MSAAIASRGLTLRRGATVNTSGTSVTWVSGTKFVSATLNGQSVLINGVSYAFTFVSTTSGTLGASAGSQTAVSFIAATAVWGDIAEVTAINGIQIKLNTVDVTNLLATWREFVGTEKEGELSLDLNFVPLDLTQGAADDSGLGEDDKDGTLRIFQLVFPDNATESLRTRWTATAFVTNFAPMANVAEALKASVTLKPTGAITLV